MVNNKIISLVRTHTRSQLCVCVVRMLKFIIWFIKIVNCNCTEFFYTKHFTSVFVFQYHRGSTNYQSSDSSSDDEEENSNSYRGNNASSYANNSNNGSSSSNSNNNRSPRRHRSSWSYYTKENKPRTIFHR